MGLSLRQTVKRLRLLFQDEFYGNVATLTSGTIIAQIIPILISPALTRLYTPKDFGVLALYLSIATVGSTVVTGRYELSILLPKENSKGLNLTVLSIVLCLIISLLSLFIILLFGREISPIIDEELGQWIYLFPLSFFLLGLYQSLNYWVNRNKEFKSIAISKIVKNVANSVMSLAFGFLKFGYLGLLASLVIGQFFSVISLFKVTYKTSFKLLDKISGQEAKNLLARYQDFPKINMFSALLNTLSIQMPVLLLTFYFNPFIVGYYALSQRILQAPMALVGSSIAQVYFQKASEQTIDMDMLAMTTMKLYKQLIRLGTLPLSFIFFFAPDIFAFVFGEEWRDAGVYSQALSPWVLLVFISSPLSNLLTVLEKHRQNVLFNVGLLASRVGAIMIGALYFNSEYLTIVLYGVVGAVVWLVFIYYLLSLVNIGKAEITRTTFSLLFKWSLPMFLAWLFIKIL